MRDPTKISSCILSSKLSPKAIYDEVSKKVVGQEQAKRTICTAVFLHFVKFMQASLQKREDIKRSHVLLMGPSGSGKTYIVREAIKAINTITNLPACPLLEVDCTSITATGWAGEDFEDLLQEHLDEYIENISLFNSSIIFLDEFDKICKPMHGSGGDNFNKNTQYSLLKTVEGIDVKCKRAILDTGNPVECRPSTKNMLFIMAGNFSEIRDAEDDPRIPIGFKGESEEVDAFVDIHKRLEDMGMSSQLAGRVAHVGRLDYLTKEELEIVLTEHLIPDYKETWKFMGLDFEITDETKKKIIDDCYGRKLGARGLQVDLAKVLEEHLFEAEFKL